MCRCRHAAGGPWARLVGGWVAATCVVRIPFRTSLLQCTWCWACLRLLPHGQPLPVPQLSASPRVAHVALDKAPGWHATVAFSAAFGQPKYCCCLSAVRSDCVCCLQHHVVGPLSQQLSVLLSALPAGVVKQLLDTLSQLAGRVSEHGQQVRAPGAGGRGVLALGSTAWCHMP